MQEPMRQAIERLSPEVREVVAYHLGYDDLRGGSCDGCGRGKGIRPALAILSAEAAGASARAGLPGAVAVELVHNFSLLHDDIIDGDRERRHRPSAWALFGTGRAIVAGDALLALAQQVLLEAPAHGANAAHALADATGAMISGQALDMAFETLPLVGVEACLAMEGLKTGALFGCASSLGAVLAGAGEESVAPLRAFGVQLGLAFQAVDDLLGIWGDPSTTGKPQRSDLRRHKKTLPVAAALACGGSVSEELAELLALTDLDEAKLVRAVYLIDLCGGRDVAVALARQHLAGGVHPARSGA